MSGGRRGREGGREREGGEEREREIIFDSELSLSLSLSLLFRSLVSGLI